MARDEDQAQDVVSDCLVQIGFVDRRFGRMLQVGVLSPHHFRAANFIDGAALRGGHQPSAGVLRDPLLRPALEGDQQGFLRQVFGAR